MRMRAVLVRTDGQILAPDWNPMLEPDELEDGNRNLEAIASLFRWRWLLSLPPSHHEPAEL
jgi:hypothetical protein